MRTEREKKGERETETRRRESIRPSTLAQGSDSMRDGSCCQFRSHSVSKLERKEQKLNARARKKKKGEGREGRNEGRKLGIRADGSETKEAREPTSKRFLRRKCSFPGSRALRRRGRRSLSKQQVQLMLRDPSRRCRPSYGAELGCFW